jgi:thioredoxin-related protein
MKKNAFLLICLMYLSIPPSVAQMGLPIGSSIPKAELKMKDASGEITSLNEIKTSNGLLVIFIAHNCTYVIKNESRTKEISQIAIDRKLGVVLLNANEASRANDDSYAAMQAYAKKQRYNGHYALDSNSELADALGASKAPECFLFDKNGKLVYHGGIDDSPADINHAKRQYLKLAIEEMLSGREITTKEGRSVGCSIKRKGQQD